MKTTFESIPVALKVAVLLSELVAASLGAIPTFKEVNEQIFTPICADCHSKPKPASKLDLQSYDSIRAKGVVIPFQPDESRLMERVISGEMPAGGDPLSKSQLQMLRDWIMGGAPNSAPSVLIGLKSLNPRFTSTSGNIRLGLDGENFTEGMKVKLDEKECGEVVIASSSQASCLVPPRLEPGKVTVSVELGDQLVKLENSFEYRLALGPNYKAIFVNIIRPKCVACHSGEKISHGLDLATYHSLISHDRAVIPYNPKRSRLYKKIREGEMPYNASPLNSEEIDAVANWILAGARDD